jgi:predicted YcjX-like family ATPase
MTLASRLADFASVSFEAVGDALATIPRALHHQSYRIAVTGLQRSGKTVFVTSFAHALLHAEKSNKEAFPFFPWRGQVEHVELGDIPGIPSFPYRGRVDELLAALPRWPAPTTEISGLRVRIRYTPTSTIARRVGAKGILDIDLVDYPGEWLLDLPMLSLSYREWSLQMEELANSGSRIRMSKDWREQAAGLDPHAPESAFDLAGVGQAYVDYLKRCRAAHLHYLQPGRFLAEGGAGSGLDSLFFPMSAAQFAKARTNGAALERRYEAYRRQVRQFYRQVFGRLRRQVVLIDLLTALQHGHESFTDLALAVRTITEAFDDLRSPLLRSLSLGRVDRLALVATKADHVGSSQLANLVALLRDMIGEPFVQANARQAGLLAIASVRATSQVARKWQGTTRQMLQGIPEGGSGELVEVFAGDIPGHVPDQAQWSEFEFNIRRFGPPRLRDHLDRPLPHINLDKLLQFLIA